MTRFAIRNLSVLNYAQGFTSWHYKAGDNTIADCSATDFFNDAQDILAVGDFLHISAADGGAIRFIKTISPNVTLESLR